MYCIPTMYSHYVVCVSLHTCLDIHLQDALSPTRRKSPHHQPYLLSPTRRHPSPLHFPDKTFNTKRSEVISRGDKDSLASPLTEIKEVTQETGGKSVGSSSSQTGSTIIPASNGTMAQPTSCDTNHMSCDQIGGNSIPSVQSIDSSQRSLPPVPDRLVPSRSTERIMDILNQRGLGTETASLATEQKEEFPLSSTPAKSRDMRSHNSSMNSQVNSSR